MTHYQGSIEEWSSAAIVANCASVVVHYRRRMVRARRRGLAVVIQRIKQGRFSVHACKTAKGSGEGPECVWVKEHSASGLKSSSALVAALEATEASLRIALDWNLVVRELALLDWHSAVVMANQRGLSWPRLEADGLALKLAQATPRDVEQLLRGATAWDRPENLEVVRLLHQKCGSAEGDSGADWLRVERRLFGNPRRWIDGGFEASFMEGLDISLEKVCGLPDDFMMWTAVWDEYNWRHLVEMCPGVRVEETGADDSIPCMSDVYYWVSVDDPWAFARRLREIFVECRVAALEGKK